MKSKFIKHLLVVLFVVLPIIILNAQGNLSNNLSSSFNDHVLDPIKSCPEWIVKNVDDVLPKSELCLSLPTGKFQTSSLVRVPRFPRNFKPEEKQRFKNLKDYEWRKVYKKSSWLLTTFKNEQESAQFVVASREPIHKLQVNISDFVSKNGDTIPSKTVKVRYVQYVPVEKARSENIWSPDMEIIKDMSVSGSGAPNIVADPLVSKPFVNVPAYRAQPIWLSFETNSQVKEGMYSGTISILVKGEEKWKQPLNISVLDEGLPSKKDSDFFLDMWMNPSAIAKHYNTPNWSEDHWDYIEKYMRFYYEGGGKNITTVITHEPWHKPWLNNTTISQTYTGYQSMVKWSKTGEKWKFDFTVFDRYVTLAKEIGIKGRINVFSMTPFHTKQKIIYDQVSRGKTISRDTLELDIFDDQYAEVWTSFLKAFKKHTKRKGWHKEIQLAFDEKPQKQLNRVFEIIKKTVPEWKNQIVFAGHPEADPMAKELSIGYVFFPNQRYSNKPKAPIGETIRGRNNQGKKTSFYLCAEPAHPNALTFSPAIESRLIPWLAIKYNVNGYLRWAFNNWTEDPYNKPVFMHTQGDDNIIYPGHNGPVSSIRWELLKEGIEDVLAYKKMMVKSDDATKNTFVQNATRNEDGRFKKSRDFLELKRSLLKEYKSIKK